MKNKIYIIGPPSSGKTTFTNKIMGRDFLVFKDNVIESTDIPEDMSDAIQTYLILPDKDEWESRGGEYTEELYEKYEEFYHTKQLECNIVLVKDF